MFKHPVLYFSQDLPMKNRRCRFSEQFCRKGALQSSLPGRTKPGSGRCLHLEAPRKKTANEILEIRSENCSWLVVFNDFNGILIGF